MSHMMKPRLADHPPATLRPVPPPRRAGGGYRFLVELHLGQDVCEWVQARRTAGKAEKAIAEEMSRTLGFPADIEISRKLLENWCGAPGRREPAAAPRDDDQDGA